MIRKRGKRGRYAWPVRFGIGSVGLDGRVLELCGGDRLYARTHSGWWRFRRVFPGVYMAYRGGRP